MIGRVISHYRIVEEINVVLNWFEELKHLVPVK